MGEKIQMAAKKPEVKRENQASQTRNVDRSQSMSSPIDQVLYPQRTIGNQAVQKLAKSGVLQAKIRIGQPGDKYEQYADRVADAVMRMPEPQLRRQPLEEREEEVVQTKPFFNESTPPIQKVRVHTDAKSAEAARAVNARAFTVGQDVVFVAGQYATGISAGRRLLAHELTHVVQ
jgi:hypothetical protein